ncbi:tRNA lysidine(34) synthetase TilS [Pelagicoccus sp. SDUM812002]|uniref:tRNA lysidine(34) synthetase TilS n=1 Tax=Pelagicoccus sp. SDUM812002 TaxID=3041266 RepID=UPI00280F9CE2|nr:tRNA lysidine(34) synthetase TilS [Pelagicoccus sp. SDUM812002]MDQ8185234.1 tRNA lysidine(34) synthetase TilS [Pelagicoccus sp. SDUM812002]
MDWEEAARRLESRIDLSRFPRGVGVKLDALERLYVACSGGADSVFALLLLRFYLRDQEWGGRLSVLHFDHDLRKEESAADATFVKELCSALNIPFLHAKANWVDGIENVNEALAREARLSFFRATTGSNDEVAAYIVTGHHGDDVVESILMRLSRGAGVRGICAPREISEAGGGLFFLRPLLDWGREEIKDTLRAAKVPWREDQSNSSDANYRARLRKLAVPSWQRAADRPLLASVGSSRRLLEEDSDALDYAARFFWSQCWEESESALRRPGLKALPVGLQRRVLALLPGGDAVSSDAMSVALNAIETGEKLKLEVGTGFFYEFTENWLSLRKEGSWEAATWLPFCLPLGARAYLPDGARLSFEQVTMSEELQEKVRSGGNDDTRIVYLDAGGNSCGRVQVRTRAPGDAFKPLGKSSPKKLKNLFIDRKIDRKDRDCLPVFVSEKFGILWVPGFPPIADKKLGFNCETALRLTYDR